MKERWQRQWESIPECRIKFGVRTVKLDTLRHVCNRLRVHAACSTSHVLENACSSLSALALGLRLEARARYCWCAALGLCRPVTCQHICRYAPRAHMLLPMAGAD